MPHKNPFLFALRDLPPEGKSFVVDDPKVWEEPLAEFGMDCRFEEAPKLDIHILPTDDGWLLRGRITARAVVPCSRCAKEAAVPVDEPVEDYIDAPEDETLSGETDFENGDTHLRFEHGALLVDLAGIAWEQFMLALPPTPLCAPDCKGLCPRCGQDLNAGSCSCGEGEGDPRMAVLRGLKLAKPQSRN